MIDNETFLNTDVPEHSIIFNSANEQILRLSKDGIWANPDVPVDEIARKVFDALEPMITTSYSSELYKKDIQLQTMKNQLDRAERILAALREPSEKVVNAVHKTRVRVSCNCLFVHVAPVSAAVLVSAAVATAEQEVS